MNNTKKIITLAVLLTFTVTLSGCQSTQTTTQKDNPTTQSETDISNFNTDYKIETNYKYFTENDTIETLKASTPYYMGNNTLEIDAFLEYEKLKLKKVDEAKNLTNQLYNTSIEFNQKISPYRIAFLKTMNTLEEEQVELGKFKEDITNFLLNSFIQENLLILNYKALDKTETANPFAESQKEYIKTLFALQLSKTLINEAANLTLNAKQLSIAQESTTNENVKIAITEMDKEFNKIISLYSIVEKLNETAVKTDIAIKQIETGEYYMALFSLDYLKSEIPKIKNRFSDLDKNPNLDKNDIETIKNTIAIYEDLTADLSEIAKTIEPKNLLDIQILEKSKQSQISLVPIAKAQYLSNFKKAITAISSTTKKIIDIGYKTTKRNINFVYKTGKTIITNPRKSFGFAMDSTGALIKAPMDLGWGLYEGNSLNDIYQRQQENFRKVQENWKNNTSGSETLDFAVKTLDEVNNMADKTGQTLSNLTFNKIEDTANYISKKITGENLDEKGKVKKFIKWSKEWSAWGIGGASKLTAGFFTSAAKGFYKVVNIQSSTGELLEGGLDLALSLIGGTKLIGKASKVLKAGAKLSKNFLSKGLTFVKKWAVDKGISKLTPIIKYINKKEGNTLLKSIAKSFESKLSKTSLNLKLQKEALDKELKVYFEDLTGGGITRNILENAKKEAADNYTLIFKTKFNNSFNDYLKILKKINGKNITEYLDVIIHSKADSYLEKKLVELISTNKEEETTDINNTEIINKQETEKTKPVYITEPINNQNTTIATTEKTQQTITKTSSTQETQSTTKDISKYNGTYTGVWPMMGATLDVKATVKDGNIESEINYSGTMSGATVHSTTHINGTVDINGNVNGTIKSNGSGSFRGSTTSSSATGSFNGKITNNTATLTTTVNSTSVSMGQSINQSYTGEMILIKQ